MESELDLHDEVQRLHILATVPEHYPIIAKLHATNTLLGLITHENSGIIFHYSCKLLLASNFRLIYVI